MNTKKMRGIANEIHGSKNIYIRNTKSINKTNFNSFAFNLIKSGDSDDS